MGDQSPWRWSTPVDAVQQDDVGLYLDATAELFAPTALFGTPGLFVYAPATAPALGYSIYGCVASAS